MPAKRCPLCHRANEARAWQCNKCGYEFGQSVERCRELLHDQLRTARIAFWTLLALDLAVLGGVVYAVVAGFAIAPGLGFAFLILWTFRARTKIAITRESLRALAGPELPKATALNRS